MPNMKKIKTCEVFGKQDRFTGKLCSQKCVNDKKRNEKIQEWLNGQNDGRRGKTATAYWIKTYLIETRGEQCEYCGWSERNADGKLPIHLLCKAEIDEVGEESTQYVEAIWLLLLANPTGVMT